MHLHVTTHKLIWDNRCRVIFKSTTNMVVLVHKNPYFPSTAYRAQFGGPTSNSRSIYSQVRN